MFQHPQGVPLDAAIDRFHAAGAPGADPCADTPALLPCPCCQGSGEHSVGRDPEALDYPCQTCRGEGELAAALLPRTAAARSRRPATQPPAVARSAA